ncbi:MAG: hypothetical protein LBV33_02645 [Lachnospiraceae bacterium]|jgi:hypothetical protein|nr:hypothetical protein [Lachnospiraceae bacterium]
MQNHQNHSAIGIITKLNNVYTYIMSMIYVIALIACFITNRATTGRLSWFYLVLAAIALAFCITNLPVLIRRSRVLIPAAAASVMVYVLLAVCNWFTNGNWLFGFAYPLATVSLIFVWCIILVARTRAITPLLKSTLISVVVGIGGATIQYMTDFLLGGVNSFYDYIRLDYWPAELIGNKVVFICAIAYALLSFAIFILPRKTLKNTP